MISLLSKAGKVWDIAREKFKESPPTFAEIRIEEGKEVPDETVFTLEEDWMSQ